MNISSGMNMHIRMRLLSTILIVFASLNTITAQWQEYPIIGLGESLTDSSLLWKHVNEDIDEVFLQKFYDYNNDGVEDLLQVAFVWDRIGTCEPEINHDPDGPDGHDGYDIEGLFLKFRVFVNKNNGTPAEAKTIYSRELNHVINDPCFYEFNDSSVPPDYTIGDVNGDGKLEWWIDGLGLFALNDENEYKIIDPDFDPVNFESTLDCSESVEIPNPPRIRPANRSNGYHSIDVDSDGDIDLIGVSWTDITSIEWIKNNGDCTHSFISQELIKLDIKSSDQTINKVEVIPSDLDNDGDDDLVVSIYTTDDLYRGFSTIYLFYNTDGLGTFRNDVVIDDFEYDFIYVEDINQDNLPEIISYGKNNRGLRIYSNLNSQESLSGEPFQLEGQHSTIFDRDDLRFGDLDNDGILDLVYVDTHLNMYILKSDGIRIQESIRIDFSNRHISDFEVIDMNRDGFIDLILKQNVNRGLEINLAYNLGGYFNQDSTKVLMAQNSRDNFKLLGSLKLSNGISGIMIADGNLTKIITNDKDPIELFDYANYSDKNIYLGQFTNDNFQDVLFYDESCIALYSTEAIFCDYVAPICSLDTEGQMFFQECGGIRYFLIRLQDGSVLDPYYAEGVDFEHEEGQLVKFNYSEKDFDTACGDVITVEINCIIDQAEVPIHTDYDWLYVKLSTIDSSCSVWEVTAFYGGEQTYLYFHPKDGCDGKEGVLYNQDGSILCTDSETIKCLDEQVLAGLFQERIWEGDISEVAITDFVAEPVCVLDTDGRIFFRECGDYNYFLIKMEDGTVVDPYYASGVEFEHEEGQYVKFHYTDKEFDTDCSDIKTVEINCIVDRKLVPDARDFDWLVSVVEETDECCSVGLITAYYKENDLLFYSQPKPSCVDQVGILYDSAGEIYCRDREAMECFVSNGLQNYFQEVVWTCGQDLTSSTTDLKDVGINMFPNPTTDVLYFAGIDRADIQVISSSGQVVMNTSLQEQKLNVSGLSEGIYFVQFVLPDRNYYHAKFVKL